MPRGLEDAVRAYQLPQSTPAQLYLSQYNIAASVPITITPGFGGSSGGHLPTIQVGSGHYSVTETFYMQQAAVEQRGPIDVFAG